MNDRLNQPTDGPASEAGRLDQLCIDTLRTLSRSRQGSVGIACAD